MSTWPPQGTKAPTVRGKEVSLRSSELIFSCLRFLIIVVVVVVVVVVGVVVGAVGQ